MIPKPTPKMMDYANKNWVKKNIIKKEKIQISIVFALFFIISLITIFINIKIDNSILKRDININNEEIIILKSYFEKQGYHFS
mgnify:CR=1 FL=1